MKPRIAVNISNCVAGGGYQIAVWFVARMMRQPSDDYTVSYIVNQTHVDKLPPLGGDTLVVDASPMRSFAARGQIAAFLRERQVECLLSMFGPSGVDHANQISGVANAFITSLSRADLQRTHGRTWPLHYLRYLIYGHMLARSAFLFFETAGERDRFSARRNYPLAHTAVIGNSVNDIFVPADGLPTPRTGNEALRLLVITSTHAHKNNHMIPAYVAAIKRAGLNEFVFALTLTPAEGAEMIAALGDDARHVELLGKLPPGGLLRQYQLCDAVVQPSSLETYSAVYNEVRFVPRALLASDRPFAREICRDFAHFFEPLDANSFAMSAMALLALLPEAEQAAWDARHAVLLPDAKYQKIMDTVAAVVGARTGATNGDVGR